MTETNPGMNDREMVAAELASGLLDGAALIDARRLQLDDADFAETVAAWERRLSGVLLETEPCEPPAELWQRIDHMQRRISDQRPVQGNADTRTAAVILRRWRLGAISASAVAASLAVLLLAPSLSRPLSQASPMSRAAVPPMFAQVSDAAGQRILTLRVDRQSGELIVRVNQRQTGATVPEIWVIPADGVPHSMGQVSAGQYRTLPIGSANRALLTDGATIAVTLEPASRTPHSAPSSEPIGASAITTI